MKLTLIHLPYQIYVILRKFRVISLCVWCAQGGYPPKLIQQDHQGCHRCIEPFFLLALDASMSAEIFFWRSQAAYLFTAILSLGTLHLRRPIIWALVGNSDCHLFLRQRNQSLRRVFFSLSIISDALVMVKLVASTPHASRKRIFCGSVAVYPLPFYPFFSMLKIFLQVNFVNLRCSTQTNEIFTCSYGDLDLENRSKVCNNTLPENVLS